MMLERFAIFGLIALAGYILYRVYHAWQLRKTGQIASLDPVLADFMQGNPGILLFTADFCAPCKTQQQPAIERLIDEMGHVQYVQVNVEHSPEAAQRWGVLSLPTTFVLDNTGQPRHINHGVASAAKLRQQVQALA